MATGAGEGDRKSERLWSPLSNMFNAFLGSRPFQDVMDSVLGGMALARGAGNTADELFGWHPRGRGGGLLANLPSHRGINGPDILRHSNRQFGLVGADAGQRAPRNY
jgi:hypothetical protein